MIHSQSSRFYPEIYTASGWHEAVKKYGDWFTYDRSPRSQIFRRDQGKVHDIDSMFKLMRCVHVLEKEARFLQDPSRFSTRTGRSSLRRYNDFQHDEFSRCECTPPYSAENAISARCDLNPANGTYPFAALGHRSHGATDAKITNSELFKTLEFLAVSGPTHDPLPPFQWSKSGLNDLHEGHPDIWKFKPEIHRWH